MPDEVSNITNKMPKLKPVPNRRDFLYSLSRKKLIKVRSRIYRFQYAREVVPPRQSVGKKKAGRKKKDPMIELLKTHNFDQLLQASDIESDYEDFLEEVPIVDESQPILKRTTSSDSIFLEYNYKEALLNRISFMHNRKFPRCPEMSRKRKQRKIRRYKERRRKRWHIIQTEKNNEAIDDDTFHRRLPVTQTHSAEIKMATRAPYKFDLYNMPKVYTKGDTRLINDVYDCLCEMVNTITAHERVSSRIAIRISEKMEEAEEKRRLNLHCLPRNGSNPLPPLRYLAVEMMTNKKVENEEDYELARNSLEKEVNWKFRKFFKRYISRWRVFFLFTFVREDYTPHHPNQ